MLFKNKLNKALAIFLTLAMLLSLMPLGVLAAGPEDQDIIKFKNMQMVVLRNGFPVSKYDYSSKDNTFFGDIAFAQNQTWV